MSFRYSRHVKYIISDFTINGIEDHVNRQTKSDVFGKWKETKGYVY